MNTYIRLLSFFIGILLPTNFFAQHTLQLRDVHFTVPANFAHTIKENKPVKYSAYYENGKILQDTLSTNQSPKIIYQYFENPAQGNELPEVVLQRHSDLMAEDFERDTLIINKDQCYSLAKYTVMGNPLFQIQSLGKKGG